MAMQLAGIIGAPVTPFKGDGIDYDTFGKQVDFLVANGVDALAHPMHIGESPNLREEERRELARILVEAAAGRVATFVNVSSAGTDLSVDLARHSAKVGSSGIVLLPPYYWVPAASDVIDHFVAAAQAHGGSLIAYNNAKATGVSLSVEMCRTLIERIPGLVGLKDASFNMETFTAYCDLAREAPQLAVLTGIEHLLTSMPIGGRGCFSACSEVAPRIVRALYNACANASSDAAPLQFKVHRLLDRLMRIYPATIKHAMALMGRPVGEARRPVPRLTPAEKKATQDELAALGILDTEPRGWVETKTRRHAVG
jgi:4-hydroxy-tetrahydrodipicolinate synthase